MPPQTVRHESAEWIFYTQKAQLLLEVINSLGSSRNNLLKDYCFLLFGKQLSADECFDQTFSAAAKRKVFTRLTPEEIVPDDEKTAGRLALKRLAVKALYSQYVPVNPVTVHRIFEEICKVKFQQGKNGMEVNASITDLPFLVEKYESCVSIPQIKLFELNELTAIAPVQLREDFYQLALQLSRIGTEPAERISYQLKKTVNSVDRKLRVLTKVDAILAAEEKKLQPLLYEQRFFMHGNWQETPLPGNIKSFMDAVERSLRR